jgi:hypothetical protein
MEAGAVKSTRYELTTTHFVSNLMGSVHLALFDIINFIVQEMITRPREINEIYQKLPENALKGIEARDKKVT